jgi:predicted Zn-dependent protease
MRQAHYALSQSLLAIGKEAESQASLRRFRELKEEEDSARKDPKLGSSNRDDQLRYASDTWMDTALLVREGRDRAQEPARRDALDAEYLRAVKEALRFEPDNYQALVALLEYHRSRRDLPGAAAVCEDLLKLQPSREIVLVGYELAGLSLRDARAPGQLGADAVERAFRLLSTITTVAPTFADAHRELARTILFFRADRLDLLPTALQSARRAVELDPGPRSYDILAFAWMQSGRPDEAKETLLDGLRRHPDDKELQDRLEKLSRL